MSKVPEALAELRKWWYDSVQLANDSADVMADAYPPIPLSDKMDGDFEKSEGCMHTFEFYSMFMDKCKGDGGCDLARQQLMLSQDDHASVLNKGVRFMMHLSHAIATVPPSDVKIPMSKEDRGIPGDLPLAGVEELRGLDPRQEDIHGELGQFVNQLLYWTDAAIAAHGVSSSMLCFTCNNTTAWVCLKDVEGASRLGRPQIIMNKMIRPVKCTHCGLYYAPWNAKHEVVYDGLKRRDA